MENNVNSKRPLETSSSPSDDPCRDNDDCFPATKRVRRAQRWTNSQVGPSPVETDSTVQISLFYTSRNFRRLKAALVSTEWFGPPGGGVRIVSVDNDDDEGDNLRVKVQARDADALTAALSTLWRRFGPQS